VTRSILFETAFPQHKIGENSNMKNLNQRLERKTCKLDTCFVFYAQKGFSVYLVDNGDDLRMHAMVMSYACMP
jgi:hypothetical protein